MYCVSGIVCSICGFFLIHDVQNFRFDMSFERLSFFLTWPAFIIFIIVNYTLGLLLSTLSASLFGKQLMGKIKYFSIKNIDKTVSQFAYERFLELFQEDFYHIFDKEKDMRLITSTVESKAANSYNTAFVFLTIYGTCRNICIIFFITGIVTIIMNVTQLLYWIFGLAMILFSWLSLRGYIRFHEYYISHIISAYVSINANRKLIKTEKKCIQAERICI